MSVNYPEILILFSAKPASLCSWMVISGMDIDFPYGRIRYLIFGGRKFPRTVSVMQKTPESFDVWDGSYLDFGSMIL